MEVRYKVSYKVNTGLVISPTELKLMQFLGLDIADNKGNMMAKDVWEYYIQSAQTEIEHYLGIKMIPQIISETQDFYRDDYRNWNVIPTTYFCVKPFEAIGWLGSVKQITYPKNWLASKKTNEGAGYWNAIFTVPSYSADPLNVGGSSILYSGVLPYFGIGGYQCIPNYWNIVYATGFTNGIPKDLLQLVNILASIPLLLICGDMALGMPALSGYSLGIDGLSQSISTSISATSGAYNARILTLQKQFESSIKRIKGFYKGVNFTGL